MWLPCVFMTDSKQTSQRHFFFTFFYADKPYAIEISQKFLSLLISGDHTSQKHLRRKERH